VTTRRGTKFVHVCSSHSTSAPAERSSAKPCRQARARLTAFWRLRHIVRPVARAPHLPHKAKPVKARRSLSLELFASSFGSDSASADSESRPPDRDNGTEGLSGGNGEPDTAGKAAAPAIAAELLRESGRVRSVRPASALGNTTDRRKPEEDVRH